MSNIHTWVKRRARLFLWGAILFFFCVLLRDPTVARTGVERGLSLCVQALIPSLFPFLVLTRLFVKSGLAIRLGRLLAVPCHLLLGLGDACGSALLLGALSGYPVGASCTAALYRDGLCTRGDAARLLAITNNAGPAFLIGGVGAVLWRDLRVGVLLYLAQLLAALIVGIVMRPRERPSVQQSASMPTAPLRLGDLTDAISQAAPAMLRICGTVLFFEVLLTALLSTLSPLAELPLLRCLLAGFTEVSAGATAAATLFGWTSPAIGIGLTGLAVGWSGLSVLCQVASIAEEAELPLAPYLRGKLLQGILTGGLAYASALWLL